MVANKTEEVVYWESRLMVFDLIHFQQQESQARQMAVEYAKTVFPPDHLPSRYVLLLACGDE